MSEAYCVKCRTKKDIKGAKETIMKGRGGKTRMAMTGLCEKYGTKVFRIMGLKK